MANVYVKPSVLLAAAGVAIKVGDVLDPEGMGWADHPTFGPLPTVRVTEARDGRFIAGIFTCCGQGCEESVHVHSGDWFQKRLCGKCRAASGKSAGGLSPEAKEAAKLERAALRAKERLDKALVAAGAAPLDQEQVAKMRAALIQKVAAEKGVSISEGAGI